MIDPGLDGKTVFITGAQHGIGAATALAFAAQGARVFVHYFRLQTPDARRQTSEEQDRPPSLASGVRRLASASAASPGEAYFRHSQSRSGLELVETIRARGGQAEAWEADLADPATPARLFDRAEAAFGTVDILIHNAAHCEPDTFVPTEALGPNARAVDAFPMTTVTAESIDAHFAVNTRATTLLTAEFARRHVARAKRDGRVISVSTDGASGFSSEISYGASKHALESYSRAAASELGPYGITVNVVSLGPIQTGWITPEIEAAAVAGTPLRRIGQPDDIADVILFLASEQARWITGQLLYVGGGHQMPL
jgi:3-oxoacyl-[acyl-carrier protein] reductase